MNFYILFEEVLIPYVQMFAMTVLGILMHENLSNLMESSDKTNIKPWADNCKIDWNIIVNIAHDSDDDSIQCLLSCQMNSIGVEVDKYELDLEPTPVLFMSWMLRYYQRPPFVKIEQFKPTRVEGSINSFIVEGSVNSQFCQHVTSIAIEQIKRDNENKAKNIAQL
ncbi:uncharacterized protein [Halyomorpha halys]|uniref:uncharacterized protein n=1 Tax=Halyomorpha halys TaxID=286706 RepID=UPI0006D4C9F6|nr:uncharacterized protein LOC106678077 [Halyomorpha halys]XP_014271858.1 uncharacterized protein LOC106678077 [Halyomorpha halys]XP_014271859.1 uncharacterized protein LOC106678077 [Halyomorpha halys]XP_024216897.1 uncharacterized protein LOC106678077 [Halyomorpha halys]